jgi:rRNA maturation endonuclease Nob1
MAIGEICPNCNTDCEPNWKHCPICGMELVNRLAVVESKKLTVTVEKKASRRKMAKNKASEQVNEENGNRVVKVSNCPRCGIPYNNAQQTSCLLCGEDLVKRMAKKKSR